MAEQVVPLTGSPLSQESRQVIARTTNLSGQTIRGANLLSPITPSETEIKNLQATQQNQASLVEVQSGLLGIKQDINQLNSGLISIATLLQQDATSEENNLRAQQESERRLAEQQIRLGKENELEKKIQAAIVAPVAKIAPKIQDLFGNVLQSLTYLFGGWLTSQVIDYIKNEGEGNNERLTEIKNNIIKNLGIAGGILIAVKFGFTALRKSLVGAVAQVSKLLGKTVAAPFNAIKGVIAGGNKTPSSSGSSKSSAPPSAKPAGGIVSGAKNFIKGLGLPLITGSVMTGLDIASGEDPKRATAGTIGGMISSGAAFTMGSLLPIPGSGLVAGALSYGPGQDFGKGLYDKFFGSPPTVQPEQSKTEAVKSEVKPQENKLQSPVTTPKIQTSNTKTEALKPYSSPQSEMVYEPKINVPDYSNVFNLSVDNTFNSMKLTEENKSETELKGNENTTSMSKSSTFTPSSLFDPANSQNFIADYNNLVSSENAPQVDNLIQPSQIQSIPSPSPQISQLPEPKPNIIYSSPNSSQQQSPQMNQTAFNGPLTDVPLIRSSNPDNFYTLYSYSCYNVVI